MNKKLKKMKEKMKEIPKATKNVPLPAAHDDLQMLSE